MIYDLKSVYLGFLNKVSFTKFIETNLRLVVETLHPICNLYDIFNLKNNNIDF